jgi:hypothetical protein
MTKIKSYPIDTNITGSDKWIGSDGNAANRTKNFTPTNLANFFNNAGSIDIPNALRFKYDTVAVGDDRSIGSISFETEIGATVAFSSITEFMLHQNTSDGNYIVDLMSVFDGNIVMVQKVDDKNVFAFYKITNYEQDVTETNFYNTSVTFLEGNGSLEEDEYYFVSLLQFDAIADTDKHYAHTQGVASATWSVSHNLDKYPSVTVVLSTGQKGYGDVTYVDENNLTISFSGAESGKAYMN